MRLHDAASETTSGTLRDLREWLREYHVPLFAAGPNSRAWSERVAYLRRTHPAHRLPVRGVLRLGKSVGPKLDRRRIHVRFLIRLLRRAMHRAFLEMKGATVATLRRSPTGRGARFESATALC